MIFSSGYSAKQCEDLNYPKRVAYKDKTFKMLRSRVIVEDMQTVIGCKLSIRNWDPDTSGKGKWFSPYWT